LFQAQPSPQQASSTSTAAGGESEPASVAEVITNARPSTVEESVGDSSKTRRNAQRELEDTYTPYRYVYPEFLPDPTTKFRNRIREKLERMDMLNRRANIDIPEFYVGKDHD
jgi:large subunit ribosomal protein L19